MEKRLYRIPQNKMIAGVCTGLAEYFNIDPVLIRLVFVILALHSGVGILAYIILWIVVPVRFEPVFANAGTGTGSIEEEFDEAPAAEDTAERKEPGKGSLIGGIILMTIGVLFLLDNFIPSFGFDDFWPLLLIAIGGGMLWNSWPRNPSQDIEV